SHSNWCGYVAIPAAARASRLARRFWIWSSSSDMGGLSRSSAVRRGTIAQFRERVEAANRTTEGRIDATLFESRPLRVCSSWDRRRLGGAGAARPPSPERRVLARPGPLLCRDERRRRDGGGPRTSTPAPGTPPSLPARLLQRFRSEEDFGGHRVAQVWGIGQRAVAAAGDD